MHLITLVYFYCDIFTFVLEEVLDLSSERILNEWMNFHLGNTAIFRVTFLLKEYSVIKCVILLHSIEIVMNIGKNCL